MSSIMLVLLSAASFDAVSSMTIVPRRDLLVAASLVPCVAHAELESLETTGVGSDRNFVKGDRIPQPQQSAPEGKLDVNAATVVEYKAMRGLYPKVAGKIASHGPYQDVKDVYKFLSKDEAALFRKNEASFVALPPGRMFLERINQRQSL